MTLWPQVQRWTAVSPPSARDSHESAPSASVAFSSFLLALRYTTNLFTRNLWVHKFRLPWCFGAEVIICRPLACAIHKFSLANMCATPRAAHTLWLCYFWCSNSTRLESCHDCFSTAFFQLCDITVWAVLGWERISPRPRTLSAWIKLILFAREIFSHVISPGMVAWGGGGIKKSQILKFQLLFDVKIKLQAL